MHPNSGGQHHCDCLALPSCLALHPSLPVSPPQVDSITAIAEVTAGEVDIKHLGNAFLAFLQTGTVPLPPGPPQQRQQQARGPPPPPQ